MKYIDSILARYKKDGLAFQRYLRKTQEGAGDDILAGNCFAIVGLYRNVYGLQPKYNRLYLEPHLTPELNGTRLNYRLRHQLYEIDLSTDVYRMQANSFSIETNKPFAMNSEGNALEYFHGDRRSCSMKLTRATKDTVLVVIEDWGSSSAEYRRWKESWSDPKEMVDHLVADLTPQQAYAVYRDGKLIASVGSNTRGEIRFRCGGRKAMSHMFEVKR